MARTAAAANNDEETLPEASRSGFFGVFRFSGRALAPRLVHQPTPDDRARRVHRCRRPASGSHGLGGCTDHRRCRGRHPACQRRRRPPTWRKSSGSWAWRAGIVAAMAGAQRGISLCQALLRAQLGQRVNMMILEKAVRLELSQFEDSRVLRQAHAGATRGLEPAAVTGDADFRPRPKPDFPGQLRGVAGPVLSLGRARAGTCRFAVLYRGNPVL